MLTAADEMAYEQNYRESDPLNLDGSAMIDPDPYASVNAAIDTHVAFKSRSAFYRKAAEEAPDWKRQMFAGGYEAVVVKIDLADKMLVEFPEAAEFAQKDAIDSYDYMEERIKDWATD